MSEGETVSGTELSNSSSKTKGGILRHNSSFSGEGPSGQGGRLSFADEYGDTLVENTFTEDLYYSIHSNQKMGDSKASSCCCTVS